jgi:tRNA(fMet)-specific endonuclease VapC
MYLLDTSARIVHLRSKGQSGLSRKLMSINRRLIQVSSVVRGELVVGAMRSTDPARSLAVVDNLLALFRSVAFEDHAANRFADVRADLERKGTPIGAYDLMIAATALSANLTVVMRDVDDYSRVVGLRVESWA